MGKQDRLSPEERAKLDGFNETDVPYDDTQTIVSLFARAAAEHPGNTAVIYRERHYTYGELDRLSDAVTAVCLEKGLGRGDVVSILIPRGEYEAIASLGALKAGCAYQPLDDTYPEERLNFMVNDAGAKLLITTEELSGKITGYEGERLLLSELRAVEEPPEKPEVQPDDLFILLYTSGSTGVPKGVRLTHRNLVCFVDWYHRYYGLTPEDCVGQYASYGFDACMMDMYPALTMGAALCIIPEEIRLNLNALNEYMEKNRVTHQFMTTQVGRQYAMEASEPYLRHLSVGGEKLAAMDPPTGFAFHNLYGPTECTILATAYRLTEREENIPIGKPLDNVKLYVVDPEGNRLSAGETGELWIAGPHVADGYLNRPEKTAEVFLANPFDDDPRYARVYRTGDLVSYREDGSLLFAGRIDAQVKIRGFRIELSEVEAVVREFEGVRDATVAAFDSPSGGKYIAAYVVGDKPIDVKALNDFIAARKPPYMVPAVTIQLDAIPLTQNHKVDKRALPVPDLTGGDAEESGRPVTKCEERLLAMASKTLGFTLTGVSVDLVTAGLTSISSISLVTAIENEFGVSVPAKELLGGCTVLDLENRIFEQLLARGLRAEEPRGEKTLLSRYPLTQTQLGIYAECMLNPQSTTYNIPYSFRMGKGLSADTLAEAAAKVIDAHGAIKCTIAAAEDGEVYMYPHAEYPAEILRKRGGETDAEAFWEDFVKPFDLARGPLYRIAVFETEQNLYLFVDFHHILFDGASLGRFMDDLDAVLGGADVEAEEYTIFDVAAAEQKAIADGGEARAKEYYDTLLRGCTGCTVPDGDRDGKVELCRETDIVREDLRAADVQRFCEAAGVTENAFFLAAMGLVLQRYTAAEDVSFTTIYNGRSDADVQNLFGMLVKTLPVRCFPDNGKTTADYVRETGRQILSSMANDIYSFAKLSRSSGLRADVMLVYQGDLFAWETLGGQKIETRVGASNRAMSDLSMDVVKADGTYRFNTQYRANQYSEAFVERLTDTLVTAARSMLSARTLGEVEFCSEKERALVERFNDTDFPVELCAVHTLFEKQAAAKPEQEAVIAAGERLSYGEMNRRANRVAHALLSRGITRESIVGLVLPRTAAVPVCEYGVWKAGGAFLPMVPDYPDERIDYCLRDANSAFCITTEENKRSKPELFAPDKPYETLTVEELLAAGEEDNPGLTVAPEALAYCIYTSGSTGKPKGVMIEHRNLCNFVNANERNMETLEFVRGGRVALGLASISFDVSMMEMHITFANGMTLVMAEEDDIHNPLALAALMKRERVEVMCCTPSFLMNVIELPEVREALALVNMYDLGAEAFPGALYEKIRSVSPEAAIINGYGPTETTISCIAKKLSSGEKITIGTPAANVRAYVMDSARHFLPVGACGELVICGDGVGRGYVNLPEKTAEAFFTIDGHRAYRSGDLVRCNDEGEIEFFGRLDNQVKLRGLRVELDEIENVMNEYPGVKVSKVIVRNNGKEDYLAGFFTASDEIPLEALTAHLKSKLTYYMVPAVLHQLPEMPLTVNGKIDKNQLPEIEYAGEERAYVAPATELERELCEAYGQILGVERVSAADSFFEIGGTSLSATRVVMFAMTRGYEIVYKDVFAHPSPRQLAAFISGEEAPADARPDVNRSAADYDYSKINRMLEQNTAAHLEEVARRPLGDIILTGATGFLGSHILHEFLEQYEGRVWCLTRKGSYDSCEHRLRAMLRYYFEKGYDELFGSRIFCVEGDITDPPSLKALAELPADTIINCAACVKHFVQDDMLDRINVKGVENLIDLCVTCGKRIIQISTTSIAENGPPELSGAVLHENELYIGQDMGNDYVRTKFLAERAVLAARAGRGLDGMVIRVGNLMSRDSDGEFQINFVTNGYMRSLKAYRRLGMFPVSALDEAQEFSPIDATAKAILTLAQDASKACVYHACNNHLICMADVIHAMRAYGFEIQIVPDETFAAAVTKAAEDPEMSEIVLGIVAYASNDESASALIGQDSRFTTNVLYRLGYKWPITDDAYLLNAIRALDTLDFFEG